MVLSKCIVGVASCHCRKLVLRVEGEVTEQFLCGCRDCQRRTGSAFHLAAWFEAAKVVVDGEFKRYERKNDSGDPFVCCFCPHCGSNVFFKSERLMPNKIGIAVGCFEDPAFPPPTRIIFEESLPSWIAHSIASMPRENPHQKYSEAGQVLGSFRELGLQLFENWNDDFTEQLLGLYKKEWWTHSREHQDVQRCLKASTVAIGLKNSNNNLVGFVRALSDGVFKSTIYDLIVTSSYRGQGLGTALLKTVLQHPSVAKAAHVELYCLDNMSAFYEQFGFEEPDTSLKFMRCENSALPSTRPPIVD